MKSIKDTKYGDLSGKTYKGSLYVNSEKLDSLEGSPKIVTRIFDVSKNKLKNLIGAPEEIGADFMVQGNPLVSLEGMPKKIGGSLWIFNLPDELSFEELLYCDIKGEIKTNNPEKLPDFKLFKTVGKDIKKYKKIMKLKELK